MNYNFPFFINGIIQIFYLNMTFPGYAKKALSNAVTIQNLNYSETEDSLRSYFSRFGHITNIQIIKDSKKQSKGHAIITYSDPEEARSTINFFHLTYFNGRQITCKFYIERKSKKEKETKSKKDDQIEKKIKEIGEKFEELSKLMKSKSKDEKPKKEKKSKDKDSTDFTNLVPVGQHWTIETPTRNILSYKGEQYVVQSTSVDRFNEGNSYPSFLFNKQNCWATDSDQTFASIDIHFPKPVVANVLTMTARKGNNSQQAPTKFEIGCWKNGALNSFKKINKVEWSPNSQQTFTFYNKTKYSDYRVAFYESNAPDKSFGLAELNFGVKS